MFDIYSTCSEPTNEHREIALAKQPEDGQSIDSIILDYINRNLNGLSETSLNTQDNRDWLIPKNLL